MASDCGPEAGCPGVSMDPCGRRPVPRVERAVHPELSRPPLDESAGDGRSELPCCCTCCCCACCGVLAAAGFPSDRRRRSVARRGILDPESPAAPVPAVLTGDCIVLVRVEVKDRAAVPSRGSATSNSHGAGPSWPLSRDVRARLMVLRPSGGAANASCFCGCPLGCGSTSSSTSKMAGGDRVAVLVAAAAAGPASEADATANVTDRGRPCDWGPSPAAAVRSASGLPRLLGYCLAAGAAPRGDTGVPSSGMLTSASRLRGRWTDRDPFRGTLSTAATATGAAEDAAAAAMGPLGAPAAAPPDACSCGGDGGEAAAPGSAASAAGPVPVAGGGAAAAVPWVRSSRLRRGGEPPGPVDSVHVVPAVPWV